MDIKSLKDKILQLAIQGTLVAQDENDEPASVLLEKIKAEKEQLIKDKVIKKEKPLPEISEEEKSFDLPKGWEWCRLGDIITLISGRDLNSSICNNEGIGIPYIMGASNMSKGGLVIERWTESPTVIGLKNDIIISVKGTVGKLDIIDLEKVHLSRQVMSMRCYSELIFNKYILLYLQSYIERIKEKSSGVIPGISRDNLLQILVAIPPIEEQKRIVAKVDELFELIDELDNNKQELLDNISNTRSKVLKLAIQGKLVEQCEDDEPASVLLERIKAEKQQLIKDKVIKKEKTLPDISEEDKVFDLPKGWEWCRFGRATICRDGERVPVSSKERQDRAKIYDYYGASGVIDKIDDYLFDSPLLLIGEDGANLISRSTPIAFIAKGKYWVNNHAHVIDSANLATLKYLEVYLNAIDLKPYVTGTAQPKLNQANLNKIPITLPPLEEQKRIVAKVDLIMDCLDTLQQEIESQEVILEDILQ